MASVRRGRQSQRAIQAVSMSSLLTQHGTHIMVQGEISGQSRDGTLCAVSGSKDCSSKVRLRCVGNFVQGHCDSFPI